MDFAILIVKLVTALLELAKRAAELISTMRGVGTGPRKRAKRPRR